MLNRKAAQFLRPGRLLLCLVAIFTKGISDSETGQAKAQHCNKSQNIHMAQPSFPFDSLSGFYVIGGSQSPPPVEGQPPTILVAPTKMLPQKTVNFNCFPAYMPKNSYSARCRPFLFRHRIGTKNVYRFSGTFRQITRSNFGYFVY